MIALSLCLLLLGPGRAAEDPYAPEAPPPRVQLLYDRTPLPPGQGALFVPALVDAEHEPRALLLDGESLRPIPIGQRVVLPPGRYAVLVGSTEPALAQAVTVEVKAGLTAVVPPRWGALELQVVDRRDRPVEGMGLRLVHAETGEPVELPSQLAPDESAPLWLLAPGLYRVEPEAGSSPDRPGFVTVHVPEGGVARLRVFVDRRSGRILGGGVVPPRGDQALPAEEEAPEGAWTGKAVLGVQGTLSQSSGVPGFPDQSTAAGSAFLDAEGGLWSDHHHLLLELHAEEGQQLVGLGPTELPAIKSADVLEGGLRYSFQFNPGAGLYVQGRARTRLLDSYGLAAETQELALRRADGTVEERELEAGERLLLAPAFSPLLLRAGAGLQFSLLNHKRLELSARGGPGYRYYGFAGVLASDDNPETPAWEFTELGNSDAYGIEGSVTARAHLRGWLALDSTLEAFTTPERLDRPDLSWTTSLDFRITSVLSLHTLYAAERLPTVLPGWQLRNGVYLRASWSLL